MQTTSSQSVAKVSSDPMKQRIDVTKLMSGSYVTPQRKSIEAFH